VQLARLASVTGRWAYTITLAVYAYRLSGPGGVALAGIARLVPAALVSPFAGALIQRAQIRHLLLRAGLGRAFALAAAGLVALAGDPSWIVYALVVVEATLSTLLRPAQNSMLPALAQTPQELTSTNLALSVIESAGVFLGPLIGAVLLSEGSIALVFCAAAFAYLVSTALLVSIPVPDAIVGLPARGTSLLQDVASGIDAIGHDAQTRLIVCLYGAQNLVAGALNVLIVLTALRLLDLGQSGVGVLTAAVGIGGVLGGALAFARLRRERHGTDLGLGLLLWGVPLVALALVSSAPIAFMLLCIVGIGVTLVDVAAITLLQRIARGDLLPHALSLMEAVFVIGVAAGTLLAPLLVSAVGVRGALIATGAFLPLLAAALARQVRRLDASAACDSGLVELLTEIPIFAPLSESTIEQLASSLDPVRRPVGALVFSQGDAGDGFYVVEEGELEVVIDEMRVNTIGRGGYFGEIALLHDVPRTASVRALSEVQLQRLDSAPFIAAVTGSVASSQAAAAVVGSRVGFRIA
jgi:predicted MFS family arabinose efflux permease